MQRAVPQARSPSGLDGLRDLTQYRSRAIDRCRCQSAQRRIEGLGGVVLGSKKSRQAFQPGRDRGHDAGRLHADGRETPEGLGKPSGDFRHNVEAEGLDGDQPFTLGFIGTENRSQSAAADLMQDAKCAEGGGRGEPGGVVV